MSRQGALSILTWIAIGRCIRRFHDLGVCHADLNAHNMLLNEDAKVYMIDFDQCQLRHRAVARRQSRAACAVPWRRSLMRCRAIGSVRLIGMDCWMAIGRPQVISPRGRPEVGQACVTCTYSPSISPRH